MSSSRRLSAKPIIEERRPDNVSPIAPSTPPTSKAVRFASKPADLVTGVTRPLTREEAWALYHFECHARKCPSCSTLQAVYRGSERLCDFGNDLAKAVTQYLYHYRGLFYSHEIQDDGKPLSIEVSPEYDHVRNLLIALDPSLPSKPASSRPTVIHQSTYPQPSSPRRERRASSSASDSRRPEIILEPGTSAASRRRPVHRSRYATVIVEQKPERTTEPSTYVQERRGTMYDKEVQRKKENYRVEIREPEQRKERRQRDDGRWQ